jgi:hypothetical protein
MHSTKPTEFHNGGEGRLALTNKVLDFVNYVTDVKILQHDIDKLYKAQN